MQAALTAFGTLLTVAAALYALAACLCRPRRWRPGAELGPRQPITVLKPLCGAEPRLEANLATFCEQTVSGYQLVFGVRDPLDPAVDAVHRLMRRYPALDIDLVIDARLHGSNFKVSNLLNMAQAARHPWLVLADSDIAVPPDYLDKVSAPLADPRTGIVTCLYRGRPLGGFWSRMGAMFIDTWFAPSVRVASAFGGSGFGFGATIALRADTLRAAGGFEALRNRLADDYWLGQLTRKLGLATVLSDLCVTTDVTEASFPALWWRERRWMQTIRSVNPGGYAFTFITFTFPMLAAGLALAPTALGWAVAVVGLAARCVPYPGRRLLLPARDCLLLLAWLAGCFGATTRWRQQTVPVKTAAYQEDRLR